MAMTRGLAVSLAVCLAALSVGTGVYASGGSLTVSPHESAAATQRALLDRYCVTCHSDAQTERGLVPVSLESVDVTNVATDAELWEKVVRKVRAGVMPPAGRPRPAQDAHNGLASYLAAALDAEAALRPDPGRTEPFHRLNRTEYQNAIRDLLGLEVAVEELLPGDDASYGFDNIAGVLRMSPTLMERYLLAAQKIAGRAVGAPLAGPNVETFELNVDSSQAERGNGLPFGTRGARSSHTTFRGTANISFRRYSPGAGKAVWASKYPFSRPPTTWKLV